MKRKSLENAGEENQAKRERRESESEDLTDVASERSNSVFEEITTISPSFSNNTILAPGTVTSTSPSFDTTVVLDRKSSLTSSLKPSSGGSLSIRKPSNINTEEGDSTFSIPDLLLKTPRNVKSLHLCELHQAVQLQDFELVEEILVKSPEQKDAQDEHGYSPLMNCCAKAHSDDNLKIAKLLIDVSKVDVFLVDSEGYTALHWCAYSDNVEIAVLLLKSCNVNIKSNDGETALHRACRFGTVRFIDLLMETVYFNDKAEEFHNLDKTNRIYPLLLDINNQTPLDVCGIGTSKGKVDVKRYNNAREALYKWVPSLQTLILHHPKTLDHNTGLNHQESSKRILSTLEALKKFNFSNEVKISCDFPKAVYEDVIRAHSKDYVKNVLSLSKEVNSRGSSLPFTPCLKNMNNNELGQITSLDSPVSDTPFSPGSLDAALFASGSVTFAVDEVMKNKFRNVFCLVRPPGHHAGHEGGANLAHSCGFCIFNNVAIGALHALEIHKEKVKRVAIIDFDIHHGNGTEDIIRFVKRPNNILFISIHIYDKKSDVGEYSFYPYSGEKSDVLQNIYNFGLEPIWRLEKPNPKRPEEPKLGKNTFKHVFQSNVLPLLRTFNSDLIFLSSGFDGGKSDVGNRRLGFEKYWGGMDLLPQDFFHLTKDIMNVAKLNNVPIVSVLEGGYGSYKGASNEISCESFANNVISHVNSLACKLASS